MRTLVSSAVWGLVPIPPMFAPGALSQCDNWPTHRENSDASLLGPSRPEDVERMATKHEISLILTQLVQVGNTISDQSDRCGAMNVFRSSVLAFARRR